MTKSYQDLFGVRSYINAENKLLAIVYLPLQQTHY